MHTLILGLDIWQKLGDVGGTILKILSFRAEVLHMHFYWFCVYFSYLSPTEEESNTSFDSVFKSVICHCCYVFFCFYDILESHL